MHAVNCYIVVGNGNTDCGEEFSNRVSVLIQHLEELPLVCKSDPSLTLFPGCGRDRGSTHTPPEIRPC